MILLLLLLLITGPSVAEGRSEWFKSLKQPSTGASCCDISDCKRTKSTWRDGQWWSELDGVDRAIPNSKVLLDKVSIDGEAYTCWAPHTSLIYCFVPPAPGS